ncbi:hypothetical protein ACT17Q_01235 [Cellulomonas sp. CW35]|uniref:Transcriptional regulator HTH-type FeoC domain-containing protein n=1 Tax=Cellulomonas uda TaxID=1714 RepID=A0A4Y3K6N8_CELUD|nr:hypothetical protein [Cellulomonas uda]NII66556.1 hypothetical protein [Cellulomonas uda]GEA79602.1 hypothetical protein CUD01_00460 [Cellulomonas uda]
MSVLDDVLTAARTGATPDAIARGLRLDRGLVDAALARLVARGDASAARTERPAPHAAASACSSCRPSPACAGCPLAARR